MKSAKGSVKAMVFLSNSIKGLQGECIILADTIIKGDGGCVRKCDAHQGKRSIYGKIQNEGGEHI